VAGWKVKSAVAHFTCALVWSVTGKTVWSLDNMCHIGAS